MVQGIPDEAFKTLPEDDKDVASQFRKMNKKERSDRNQGLLNLTSRTEQFKSNLNAVSKISQMPERTPEEIRLKQQRYIEHQRGDAWLLNEIASLPIAQFYIPKTEANRPKICTDAQFQRYLRGEARPQGQIAGGAGGAAARKRFFHWFIEFPEIIERGGFDCILGNPPYLWGQALSSTFGYSFCNYVRWHFAPAGLCDAVVYFVRRIFDLLAPKGVCAFITTNSIKDGDNRRGGLDEILSQGGEIIMTVRAVRWPGRAKLVVSLVAISRMRWEGYRFLDAQQVPTINSLFESLDTVAQPEVMTANKHKIFQGVIIVGDGFILSPIEAQEFLTIDSLNDQVVRPILNGEEVNNLPEQAPSRYAINFLDWPEPRARGFRAPFERVLERVKPFRQKQKRELYRTNWWQYAEHRPGLFRAIAPLRRCFVMCKTTKHLAFSAAIPSVVFSQSLYVLATERWDVFGVLQSNLHEAWARRYSGALKQDLSYASSNCFDTFPFPAPIWSSEMFSLASLAERYHEHRREGMLSLWLGLTGVYNLFHSRDLADELQDHFIARAKKDPDGLKIPEEHRARALAFTYDAALAGILELRRLHIELDTTVRDAYGWQDLDLAHDFYEVETLPENDRVRYTISPAARKELLKRLLKLNHERAAEETAIEAAKTPIEKKKKGKAEKIKNATLSLFE
ncbi:MAG: hypothetical protein JW384_00727 [Nitrosomonadaceae bacterium]|nr:hypothetical protein [Nitrosomonadaceae bacterium]